MSALPLTFPGHWESAEGHEMASRYADKSRADLPHGEMSDFALANRMFLAGPYDLDLTAWQQSAKDRMRWLSAQLATCTVAVQLAEAEARSRVADMAALHRPRPAEEWHEDLGDVLWHRFPIEEPPYVGSPLDSDWPGYHTHWTPLPSCQFIMDEAALLGIDEGAL